MTSRLKVKDQEDEVVSDWKFAAMVIDRWDRSDLSYSWTTNFSFRFCLITFTTFTVITTATVLMSAPHVIVE